MYAQQPAKDTAKPHMVLGLSCTICHQSGTKQPATEKSCVNCHGDYATLGEKNANTFTQNPHQGHLGHLACTVCHHGHKPDTQYCQSCHPEMEIEKAVPGPIPMNPPLECKSCHPEQARKLAHSAHARLKWADSGLSCRACHIDHSLFQLPKPKMPVAAISGASYKCLHCHERFILPIMKIDPEGELHSGPRAPKCSACHDAHSLMHTQESLWKRTEKNNPISCLRCHKDVQKLHLNLQASKERINNCDGCHVSHAAESSPLDLASETAKCIRCHSSLPGSSQAFAPQIMKDLKRSAHASLQCGQCHTRMRANHSLSKPKAEESTVECVGCHQRQARDYSMSVHGQAPSAVLRVSGNNPKVKLPRCIDCHGTHKILKHTDPMSPVSRERSVQLCIQCHSGKDAASYFFSYHGKANKLGSTTTAQCVDCHGAHAVFVRADARSSIAPGNLKATCGRCHQGANEKFVQYASHAQIDDKDKYSRLYFVMLAMQVLLATTHAFFILHLLFWLPRSLKERRLRNAVTSDSLVSDASLQG